MLKSKFYLLLIFFLFLFADYSLAQDYKNSGDEMKTYYMVFLKDGMHQSADTVQTNQVLKKHMANILKLYKERKLVLAGPFTDEGELKGILIFDVKTREEAEKIINADPAVISGDLLFEIRPWLGPVSLKKLY